ncbi:MAG TPA: site-specific integrase [Pyrinomonadaceae bacterium]|nr:site-specific integrase [Pyrinomonadaceae bacterium]
MNPDTGTRYIEVKKSFASACREAGISDFTFHDLRHTFGTRLADAGVDVVKIKELVGHASIVTTMHYIHATDPGKFGRLWCCQSTGSSIVASLSQANSASLSNML